MTADPHAAARARKAARIAVGALNAGITAAELATSGEARAKATTLANTLPPSLDTWQLALGLLEVLEEQPPPRPAQRCCCYCGAPMPAGVSPLDMPICTGVDNPDFLCRTTRAAAEAVSV